MPLAVNSLPRGIMGMSASMKMGVTISARASMRRRTRLPLGPYRKTEIRQMAMDYDYPELAKKSESYEICFVPDNDYRGFLKRRVDKLEEKVMTVSRINMMKYDRITPGMEAITKIRYKDRGSLSNLYPDGNTTLVR